MLAARLANNIDFALRATQYGYRKTRRTTEGIALIRRILEQLYYSTSDDVHFVFLDWSKAFDRVDTMALEEALKAYGINGKFLKAI